jgi:hypothetical protein
MSYIGREPTPVPLSTADYQDASVTAAKLAPNAAVGNIGYTPFDAAGGTISGAVDINGTTDLVGTNVVGTLDVTGDIDLTGNFIQNPASGTFTLAQDPTLALQAATKQYVDNNFQLATGAVQALSTNLVLTSASARVFEFTSVTQYVTVTLPNATTLSISNGKFVFRNEGGNPFGVYDNAGNLIGAVGPNSTATCYLYDISTAAGKWSLVGDDVRPFYIVNSNTLTASGVATQDTLVSTNFAVTVRLTSTLYVVIHPDNTATNQQIVAYAVSTASKPAVVGNRTVVPQLSTAAGAGNPLTAISLQNIVWAYRVSDTQAYVANASGVTAHALLTVTGTSISTTTSPTGAAFGTVPQTSTTLGEFSQIQRIADNLYLYMNATSAATFSYQAFKIEGTSILVAAAVNSGTVTATGGGGIIDPRLVAYNAGTGVGTVAIVRPTGTAANFGLVAEKVTVTANGTGVAPSVVLNSTVAVPTAAITTTNAFGFAIDTGPVVTDSDYGVVCYYQAGTQLAFNGLSGLQGTGAITIAAQVLVPNGAVATVASGSQRTVGAAAVAPVYTASGAGLISNARALWFDSYGNSAWRAIQMSAAFTRFVKIVRGAGAVWTATLADISMPDGTASLFSLFPLTTYSSRYPTTSTVTTDPTFAIISNAAITPGAGPQGGAKIYVLNDQGGKINFVDITAPDNFSIRDNSLGGTGVYTPYQSMITRSGYFVVPIGTPTATTTNQLSFNTFAFFKMASNGSMRYFGKWQLPLKGVNELLFTTVWGVQDNKIVLAGNSTEYDGSVGQGNHFRRFIEMDMAVVS